MPDWKRNRSRVVRPESATELLCPELLADPFVDRAQLNELLRDPSPLADAEPAPPYRPHFDHDDPMPRHRPDPAEPVDRESRAARVAKLAGLTVAIVALCGAVVAASHAAGRDRSRIKPERPVAGSMSGAHALIGFDDVASYLGGSGTEDGARSGLPEVTTAAPRTGEDAQPRQATPDPTSTATTTTSSETATELDTVRAFYDTVVADPTQALSMLGPDLLDSGSDQLIRSWESVTSVTLHELRAEADGMVRVVVTMVREDDHRVRMTQLLSLSTPSGPISEAKLLSSQRTSVTQESPGG